MANPYHSIHRFVHATVVVLEFDWRVRIPVKHGLPIEEKPAPGAA